MWACTFNEYIREKLKPYRVTIKPNVHLGTCKRLGSVLLDTLLAKSICFKNIFLQIFYWLHTHYLVLKLQCILDVSEVGYEHGQ